jgi:signal transduction histidine kinase
MKVTDRSLITRGRILAATSVALGMGALVMALIAEPRLLVDDFTLNLTGVLGVGLGVVVWVAIPGQPRNGAVWALLVSAFFASVGTLSGLTATLLVRQSIEGFTFETANDLLMSDLSTTAAWVVTVGSWTWVPAYFVALTLGLMIFPDGRAPSRRWRWLGWFSGVVIVITSAADAWLLRTTDLPIATYVGESSSTAGQVLGFGIVLLPVLALLSVVALIVRYRRSRGVERQQIRWVAWGSASMVLALIAALAAGQIITGSVEAADTVVDDVLVLIGEVLLIMSFAIAITKYRLYDIDVVISKTVAYISLAVVVGAIYAGAVLGFVAIFGDSEQRAGGDLGVALPIGAAALVAIVFEPVRHRLQGWANRLVYGQRTAPHEVLSRLTTQLAESSSEEGLAGLAQLLREGTGADSAAVWLRVGDRLRVEAVWPPDAPSGDSLAEQDLPASEVELSVPVRHSEELLGALGISKPRSHPVTPADQSLLADVAPGAGLLLRNLRLNAELAERAVDLRASRRRLIAAHDAARHRLERDLHDGAQQQVVALKVRLGLAKTIAEREGADDVAVRVADLAEGAQRAVDAMRVVARGIYPPLLDAEGLGPALAAVSRSADLPLQITLGTLPRYSKEVEETVYFCAVAAVSRAKMAGATSAEMDVTESNGSLTVTIDHDAADNREDLSALTDRTDAFEGTVTVDTSEGKTTLTLALPVGGELLESAAASGGERVADRITR